MLPYLPPEQHAQLTAHKRHGLDCTNYRAKSRSYRYEPNIENARVLLAPTLDELVAVCLIAPNLENVLQLLVRERMQVLPGRFDRRFHPVSATLQSDRRHALVRLVPAISRAPQPTRT